MTRRDKEIESLLHLDLPVGDVRGNNTCSSNTSIATGHRKNVVRAVINWHDLV
jgi:hypothetical protein